MKYLLTFNIKYIFVFTVLAFALLFTVLASSTDGQDNTTTDVRGNISSRKTIHKHSSLDAEVAEADRHSQPWL